MGRKLVSPICFVFVSVFMSLPAWADLYRAAAAVEKQDLAKAFELYMALAQLGHPFAQESVAAMYVNGEGVRRDNVLGYAWAKLAIENDAGETSHAIVTQLEPHMNATARQKAADLHAQYGLEALARRILPVHRSAPPVRTDADADVDANARCRMRAPAHIEHFYPRKAKEEGITGRVLVEAPVNADGSTRNPRTWYSFPLGVFDEAGRAVALSSSFSPRMEDGVVKPCSVLFKVNFWTYTGIVDPAKPSPKTLQMAADLKAKAEAGDPLSQLAYGALQELWTVFKEEGRPYAYWFLKSAQAGVPAAQFVLGSKLLAGKSVEEDAAKGQFWLEQGARGGSGAAQVALASHLMHTRTDEASRNEAFEWMRRASDARHREGMLLFAAMLVSWPDSTRREADRAIALLDELGNAFDYDPASSEIRAMALAAKGDFEGAKRAQSISIRAAKKLKWDTSRQTERLRAYERGQLLDGELIAF